ncbi:MAG: hypothetical protein Q9220_005881 [cf. Caloplaca sp. 1 TL-2023]
MGKGCMNDDFIQCQSDTVYALLKAVTSHLFSNLIKIIFQHTDQEGRDSVLRALSRSVAHLELDKVFSSLGAEDKIDIYDTLAAIKLEKRREIAEADLSPTPEALLSPSGDTGAYGQDYSPTPDPAETGIARWISDQQDLMFESGHKRKRHYSDTLSEHDILNTDPQRNIDMRRQPDRSCKSKARITMRDNKPDLGMRKIARPKSKRRSRPAIPRGATFRRQAPAIENQM